MAIVALISPSPATWMSNSTGPIYTVRLKDDHNGRPQDISGATLSGKLGSVSLTGTFALVDGPTGTFTYAPATADSAQAAGRYQLQFKAVGSPGGTLEALFYPVDLVVSTA